MRIYIINYENLSTYHLGAELLCFPVLPQRAESEDSHRDTMDQVLERWIRKYKQNQRSWKHWEYKLEKLIQLQACRSQWIFLSPVK